MTSAIFKSKMRILTLWTLFLPLLLTSPTLAISSTSPVWVASDFFKAGAHTFISTQGGSGSEEVNLTYSTPHTNPSLKTPTMGITDLGYNIRNERIQVMLIVTAIAQTYFRFRAQFNLNSYLYWLKLTYLAIDNSFTPPFSMNYFFPYINRNGPFSISYSVNFTASTGVTLDTTHENVLLPFMHYIDVASSSSGDIDISMSFTLLNGSYYGVTFSTVSSMRVNYAGFSRMIFDKTAIEALGDDYFNYGIVSSTSNSQPALATTIPPDIIPANLFYGLHSFHIDTNPSQLNFNSSYTVNSGAIGFTSGGTYSFASMKWSYMHHKTRKCPPSHPYYNISELLCYDQCAIGWYADLTVMKCYQCLYDCYTCTDGSTCSTCNSSVHHRTLSLSRCAPEPGYYDDGTNNPIAQPCTSPCATCTTSATFCLSCITGYYLNGSTCLPCSSAITNCSTCTNSSYCTLCNDGVTTGSTCTVCTASQYYIVSSDSCGECSVAVTNCQSCTGPTSCTMCQSNYTLHSGTNCSCNASQYESGGGCLMCSSAISYCSSCTSASNCVGCMSTFTLISPTNCACNGTTFLNTTSTACESCTKIATYCHSCTISTCTACTSNFTLSSGACICPTGYYANSTSSTCESCSIMTHCTECTSVNTCTACATGYKVNTTDNQCIVQPCTVTNCDTCIANSTTVCQSCYSPYSVGTAGSSCSAFCGNGVLDTANEKCDDGNSINGDGCSSSCTVETGFSCYNQVVNSSSTYSACFWTDPVTFSNVWIRKYEGNNSLKFEFQLNQEINEWANVNFTNILTIDHLDSSNVSSGLVNAMIDSYFVGYKAASNRFWVIINYANYDMESQTLSFEIRPYDHNAYPAFTPPNNVEFVPPTISLILKVVANNNQNSNLYTDYEYGLYGVSVVVTYIVVGMALFGILGSLVFRAGKIIVFEMVAVMQICYFSIASLDSFNPVFSGLLPLRYLAGILTFKDIEQYLEQTTSPNSMKGIYMFLNLSSNFSWVAAGLACFVGLGGLFLAIYHIADYCSNPNDLQNDRKRPHERKCYIMYRMAFHFMGQIGLSLIFFCVPLYMTSLFFEVLFTMGESSMASYAQGIGVGLAMICYFVALIKSDHPKDPEVSRMGEYISEFSKISCFKVFKYVNYELVQILVISGLIVATIYSNSKIFSAMCIVFACVADIVVVAVVKPYRYGFVSCCNGGQQNDTEIMFQKIELYQVYNKAPPAVVRLKTVHEITHNSEQSQKQENNSEIFVQHYNTKRNVIKTKHQGLVQGGQVLNQTKLFLFNNNSRRIVDLVTIIVVQFIFICAKIYASEINKSYEGLTGQNMLPLIIHIMLFLNVIYNYAMLILQIVERKKDPAKVDNEKEQAETSENFAKSIYTQAAKQLTIATNSNSMGQSTLTVPPIPTNKLIIKNNSEAASVYDLKRPQIIRPDRIKRKHRRDVTVNTQQQ